MRMKTCLIIIFSSMIITTTLGAQERIPGEYDPEEFISLNSGLGINTALEIINQLSQRYENKMIIDQEERSKPIGVVVDNMHWKRALEYILRSNLLKYVEHPRHYEIVAMKEEETVQDPMAVTYETREIEIKAVFFEADQQTLAEIGVDWSTLKDGKVKILSRAEMGSQSQSDLFSVTGQYVGNEWSV
ncbi:MAG: hypothetical protein V2J62_13180, partial [candidate division KSB1 bacterium]|nr:hypothetical protein [candidate division KSB1 bacterium]